MEMDIYYYCTYSRSPVGYVLGTLAYHPNQSSNYELKEENIEPLIRKCFEQGRVQKGFGLLPNSSKYFVLVKSLDAEGTTDEDADYNMNIAFVTKDRETYRNLLREGNDQKQGIANALKETMEINRKSDFGFTVRPRKLNELLEKSFRSLFDENDKSPVSHALESAEPYTYFGLLSSQTDLDDLRKSLGLVEQDKALKWMPNSKKWVIYCKKKRTLRNLIATAVERFKEWVKRHPVMSAIAAAMLLGGLLFKVISLLISLRKG